MPTDEECRKFCLKMKAKYPQLQYYLDGIVLILEKGKYNPDDYACGLYLPADAVPWRSSDLSVWHFPGVCDGAVPKYKLYTYRGEVKVKVKTTEYHSTDNFKNEERKIDELMNTINEYTRMVKLVQTKNKLKEMKKDFKKE